MAAPNTTARPSDGFIPNPKLRLREQVREVIRFKQFSRRTEEAYWIWIRQFMLFCRDHPHLTPALSPPAEGAAREQKWRHPRELGKPEVEAFLSHLTTAKNVAVSTQTCNYIEILQPISGCG